jgi:hypothetical protein
MARQGLGQHGMTAVSQLIPFLKETPSSALEVSLHRACGTLAPARVSVSLRLAWPRQASSLCSGRRPKHVRQVARRSELLPGSLLALKARPDDPRVVTGRQRHHIFAGLREMRRASSPARRVWIVWWFEHATVWCSIIFPQIGVSNRLSGWLTLATRSGIFGSVEYPPCTTADRKHSPGGQPNIADLWIRGGLGDTAEIFVVEHRG